MKGVRGESIEPSVSENENVELREQEEGGGRRDERGWRTGREREGESFITVDGDCALRAAGAGEH